jgi:hypothetical protein
MWGLRGVGGWSRVGGEDRGGELEEFVGLVDVLDVGVGEGGGVST